MSRYYTYSTSLIEGTVARSGDVNLRFQAVDVAFGAVEDEMDRTVRHASDNLGAITDAATVRKQKLLQFDAAGALVVSANLQGDISAAGFKITNLPTPATSGEPVTLGYLGAYSASLAGIPSPTGHGGEFLSTDGVSVGWAVLTNTLPAQATHNGHYLTTDGSAASWVAINQIPAYPADRGLILQHNGTTFLWTVPMSNRVKNTSGENGSTDWTLDVTAGAMTMTSEVATSTNGASAYGYHWKSGVPAGSSATFRSEYVPANTGEQWVVSAEINSGTISAGTISLELRYYDSGNSLLGGGTFTTNLVASTDRRYQATGVAPSSTAKCAAVITWASASGGAIYVRKVKVEKGAYATPFNMDATVQYALAPRASYAIGSAVTTTIDFHSTSGAQQYDTQFEFSGGVSGTARKGTFKVQALRLEANCVIGFSAEIDKGNSGSAITVDLGESQNTKVTVNNNTTITLTAPLQVQTNRTKLVDSGGPRTIAWAGAAVTWIGGASPSFSAAGKTVFVSTYYDGTVLWGQWVEA